MSGTEPRVHSGTLTGHPVVSCRLVHGHRAGGALHVAKQEGLRRDSWVDLDGIEAVANLGAATRLAWVHTVCARLEVEAVSTVEVGVQAEVGTGGDEDRPFWPYIIYII